ncbi:MAG: hypothetical protein M3R27_03905 [Bacteroidota bacterium]|nr:hypothetical protein [Bacteroidota bacterium]
MKQIFSVFILSYFLGACTREVSTVSFQSSDSVAIDESSLVITRFPSSLKQVDDSILGMINNGQNLSLYNMYSGKNVRNFSTQKVNFDSLIQTTFQKQYAGKRIYMYDAATAGGLSDGNSQVLHFDHANDKFYIYVNTMANVDYNKDTSKINQLKKDPQVKAMTEKIGGFKIIVSEYLEFLFVTDKDFHTEEIIPLYPNETISKNKYSCLWSKSFAVDGNSIYVPILQAQDNINLKDKIRGNATSYSLAKVPLGSGPADFRLSDETISLKDFTTLQFYNASHRFKKSEKGLLYTNGKEICNIEDSEKIFVDTLLKKNEWLVDFYTNGELSTFVSYTLEKKKNPSETDIAYQIDSISGVFMKAYDHQGKKWVAEKIVSTGSGLLFLLTKDKIIRVEKKEENYYFQSTSYVEN